jgi:hypothetical protein
VLLLALAAALAALSAYGFYTEALFRQDLWTPVGHARLAWFAGVSTIVGGALAWFAPRWLARATLAAGLAYAVAAVGPLAGLAAATVLASSWAFGKLVWREADDAPALALGLACWVFVFGIAVRWPINYPALWWTLLALPLLEAWRRGLRPRWPDHPSTRAEAFTAALLAALLAAHGLIALKPEASGDGLAMHLVIAARTAEYHHWAFDVTEFAWAVMPMGGDWAYALAYLLGGEAAARLLNFGVLGLILALLAGLLKGQTARWISWLALAAFASGPITHLVSGSMFVENFWAAFLLAAFAAVVRGGNGWAVAALCGAAAGAKFGALALAAPLLFFYAWRTRQSALLAGFAVFAAQPYLDAWLRTGNPLFPFFNHFWKSPFFESAESFADNRFRKPLTWRVLYDATFRSSMYLECVKGSFGFQWLVFLPLALASWRKNAPRWTTLTLVFSLAGGALLFSAQSNLRYLFPVLALWTLLAAWALKGEPRLAWLLGLAIPLNVYFWAASCYYHRDFLLNQVFDPSEVTRYLRNVAPTRPLVAIANGQYRGQPLAFLGEGAAAGALGRAYPDSWHSILYVRALQKASSAEELAEVLRARNVTLWIGPQRKVARAFSRAYARDLAARLSEPVATSETWTLYRLLPKGALAKVVPAQRGTWDELDDGASYTGPWARDLQFKEPLHQTLMYCNVAQCSASIEFVGKGLTLLYTAAFNRGQARLWMDSADLGILDQYAPDIRWMEQRRIENLPPGRHRLVIEVLGRKQPAAKDSYIDLDGFIVQ